MLFKLFVSLDQFALMSSFQDAVLSVYQLELSDLRHIDYPLSLFVLCVFVFICKAVQ